MALPPDPLQSPLWENVVERFLQGPPIVFDEAVKVGLPPVTEDQTQVPISIDARALGKVDEVVVIGDLNPFPLTLKVRPKGAPAFFAFRMRIEQGTVIRAAALKDGQWRVGAAYLDAAGGGCSAPPVIESHVDWNEVGHMRAKLWRETADLLRLRLRIVHPMDTGLQKQPAFFIQSLALRDAKGAPIADLEVHEPIAKDPTFSVLVTDPKGGDHLAVTAKDSDGNSYDAKVPLPPATTQNHYVREGRL